MAGNANSGSKRDKLIREAMMVAAKRTIDGDPHGRTYLAKAVEEVMIAAAKGDLAAFKEVADRIDGKAHQSMDVTTTHERSASELPESELDAAIAAARAARIAGGEKAPAGGKAKPDRVH